MQTDNVIGEVSVALAKHGLAENTLVIFTSDNGCSKAAGIPALAEKGHLVSAHLRGSKADIWDGGHRIPFIVRWPGKVEPGTTTSAWLVATLGQPASREQVDDHVEVLKYSSRQITKINSELLFVLDTSSKREVRRTVFFECADGVLSRYWVEETEAS